MAKTSPLVPPTRNPVSRAHAGFTIAYAAFTIANAGFTCACAAFVIERAAFACFHAALTPARPRSTTTQATAERPRRPYDAPVVLAGVILLYVFVAANFAYSLRLAYAMAVNADGGGYPILAHAAHNFLALLFALILLPKVGDVPLAYRCVAGAAVLVVPVANVGLIIRFARRGERRRAATRAGGGK